MSATGLAVSGTVISAATAGAQGEPPPPPLRNVKYTRLRREPTLREIYYRDVDPPNWADYSHNPYVFTPKVEADVGPDRQWNLDVRWPTPNEWAMVVATAAQPGRHPTSTAYWRWTASSSSTHQGPKGALCSIRNW